MQRYVQAMTAGFIATVVLSILMMMKASMGLMPQLDVIHMLSAMAHAKMGVPAVAGVGWVVHFLIGTVLWGLAFAVLLDALPGRNLIIKGLIFGTLAWLLMMLIPMPMAGAGLFGLKIGIVAPIMTLVLHLIWGAVLGFSFDMLRKKTA